MTVQEKPAEVKEVPVLKERAGTLTGLLFTFFVCTLILLFMVLSSLWSLEERIGNIEGRVSNLQNMGTLAPADR